MILRNKPKLKEHCVLELTVNNGVEINMLKKIEDGLLGYLRRELNNGEISISHIIASPETDEKLYVDEDKFNDMALRNPMLLKLKERLGLDSDY